MARPPSGQRGGGRPSRVVGLAHGRARPVSWASRTRARAGPAIREESFAAAHAACYCMAFSHELGEAGFPPERLEASAECSFERQDGGWGITSMHLSVRGIAPGCPPDTFDKLAAAAKDGCPVSKALAGNVDISLDATLATS